MPETKLGKAFTIAFVLVGIPFFAYMVNSISADINDLLNLLKKKINSRKEKRGFLDCALKKIRMEE